MWLCPYFRPWCTGSCATVESGQAEQDISPLPVFCHGKFGEGTCLKMVCRNEVGVLSIMFSAAVGKPAFHIAEINAAHFGKFLNLIGKMPFQYPLVFRRQKPVHEKGGVCRIDALGQREKMLQMGGNPCGEFRLELFCGLFNGCAGPEMINGPCPPNGKAREQQQGDKKDYTQGKTLSFHGKTPDLSGWLSGFRECLYC